MGRRSSLHENVVRVKSEKSYVLRAIWSWKISGFSQDFLEFLEIAELLEVASNLLKIGQQVAHGEAVIGTRTFCARQNSYGFRVIWSSFFFREIFTKFDLALNAVSENHLKLEQRVFMMFQTIWQRDFVGVKSLIGTPLDWKICSR